MLIALLEIEKQTLQIKRKAFNLSKYNYFARNQIKEAISTFALQISSNLQTEDLQEINYELKNSNFKFYVKKRNKIYLGCIENEYSVDLIDSVLDKCKENDLNEILNNYSDYRKHDQMYLINEEIEQSKIVLKRTLDAVINRGESLEGLSENAEKLEMKSRELFQKAKKQNKFCC